MRKARRIDETFVGLNWTARKLNLDRKLVYYWAVKFKLRTFKFKGVRYVESEDMLFLIINLNARYQINQNNLEEAKEKVTETIPT